MKTVIVYLHFLLTSFVNLNSVDLNECKLTHLGSEYLGKLNKTKNDLVCQSWSSVAQKGSELIINEAFPERCKELAKNYCRNPNNDQKGPWCYTTKKKLIMETCDVPLCKSSECRVSGPGVEYTGVIEKSVSGKKCANWKKKHKLKEKHSEPIFKNRHFPDGSVEAAKKYCRNPDGSISGPWCYVKVGDDNLYCRELCDIPFCDDIGDIMYSEGSVLGEYFFFSSINETQSLNISFRLWNPADWNQGELYLFLSVYDIASNREDIERWNSGIEIKFSSLASGVVSKEQGTLTNTPLILSGAQWTNLEISWTNADNQSLIIQVYQAPKSKLIAITEIFVQNTILQTESFRYFSLGGFPAFWQVFSKNDECPVHSVSQMNYTRYWLIKKTTLGKDIDVFIRAKKYAVIAIREAPMNCTHQVEIVFDEKDKIKIFTYNDENHLEQIKEMPWHNILNLWKWEYFKITFFRNKLQLFWIRETASNLLLEVTHSNVERIMWVAFGSSKMSYWTINCDPRGISDPPPAHPPECVIQEAEPFNGTMSFTKSGRQCIPWTDVNSLPEKYRNDDLFKPYGGRVSCQNFCRNLDCDPKGAYCIVKDLNSESGFGLEHCNPRLCSLGDCKLAGTANDYIGKLNITRSKRECKVWTEVNNDLVNIKNFPDPTLQDARNFCRNPSKSVAGTWCFTKDRKVPEDFCFIKDCDKPLECTALTSGFKDGTYIYISPAWRKHGLKFWLKAWNPDIYEGLVISLFSLDYTKQYTILMGAEDNEKLKLHYKDEISDTLLSQKTLPHLIPTGKWKGYWLRPGSGKIELGYNDVPTTFFEWSASKKELSFEPMLMNYGTIQNHWIGVNFLCSECFTTQTSVDGGYKIYPINLWHDETVTSNLHLNMRGTGSAFVSLMWTQDFKKKLSIQIMSNSTTVFILQFIGNTKKVLASFAVSSAMAEREWSEYIISFTESSLIIHKDNDHLLEWTSPFPLLFYWFAVTAEGGTVTWSANCPPADIDGEPRDGNWGSWGPWSCSVTCGKGVGKIERECNDPPPNVYGKDCKGASTYEGPCNDFPCGKISPDTNNIIRQYLSSQHKSLQVDVTERIVLKCNPRAIMLITAEVSETNITWTHNGFPYSRTRFHMDENYSLVIPRAQEKHNGIYLCMAYQDSESIPSKVVLEVISLVVIKPKPTKKIRKGSSLTLKCNSLALSYVYADLSQRWELNGTVWKDYGLGTLQTFTMDTLENISDSHAGIWTCVVIQEDFKYKWTTNWIYLKVKSAPSFWSHLMEDVVTAPLFGKLGNERNAMFLFFALIGLLISIIILVTALLIKWLRKPKKARTV